MCVCVCVYVCVCVQGRIQDFHLGGAQKIICANAYYERKLRSPFRQGSRARLRALEALGFFNAPYSAIWALCLSMLIQNGL